MTPRPDLSWQSIALEAKVDGPFVRPAVSGTLDVDRLKGAGASAARIIAKVQGNAGAVRLQATLAGIHIPGPRPDLLAAAPVQVTAEMRLTSRAARSASALAHPLITAEGDAATAGRLQGKG